MLVKKARLQPRWDFAPDPMDRLMHRAHILEFEGKCYRLKEAASRLTRLTSADVKLD